MVSILHFLVTFYSVYEVNCDQKVEYGTIKTPIVRISPLYQEWVLQNEKQILNQWIIYMLEVAIAFELPL